jgi:phage-related protein
LASDEELGTGSIRIDLDDTSAVGDTERLGDRISRILDRASRDAGLRMQRNINRAIRQITPVRVRVEADLRAFGHSIDTLANFDPVQIPVSPEVDRAQFEAAIQATLDGLEVSVRVVPDLDGLDAAIRAHNAPDITVNVNADSRSLTQLSGALSGVGRAATGALRLGAVGIAAASAAQGVVALTVALAPAVGALAALPAVITGAVAANAALKLALTGVSDAFEAGLTGSAEEFEKALEKLSPAAQSAAKEVRALKGPFEDLKNTVQDAFFEPLEGQITGVAKALGGPLKSGLSDIAGNFGLATQRIAEFLQTSAGIDAVAGILKGTDDATKGLAAGVGPLAAGFLKVAGSISEAFGPRLQDALANTGAQFGNFLGDAAESGNAVAWVDGAIEVFGQLGEIAANVGGIISGVFSAANGVGGGLLNNLEQITGQMEAFVKSAQGQESIGQIFTALSQGAAQVGPILSAIITALGGIAPAIGDAFTTIGPVITELITALGEGVRGALPDLQGTFENIAGALSTLAPALPGVVEAFASLAKSASDLLIPLAPIASLLLQIVAPVVELASPLIVAAGAFLALVKGIQLALTIVPLIQGAWLALNAAFIASPLGVIAAAVVALGLAVFLLYQKFEPVRDVVDAVGRALKTAFEGVAGFVSSAATAVADFVTAIPGFFASLPETIGGFFTDLGTTILDFFTSLPATISGLFVTLGTTITTALTTAGTAILTFFVNLPAQIGGALLTLGTTLVTSFVTGVAFLLGALAGLLISIVQQFIALPGQIGSALISLGTFLLNAFTTAHTAVVGAITSFISSAVAFFTALPGQIYNAVLALPGQLLSVFNSAKTSVLSTVTSLISSAVSFFTGLPGKAASAVGSIVGSLTGIFTRARDAVVAKAGSLVNDAVGLIRELPGKAKSALGNIGSTLVSAGADLVRGFINGIKSLAGQVASAAADLVGKAKDAFTDGLKIFSPSRVTRGYGINVGQGFINGMASTREGIGRAADTLVDQIRNAFKGKNTRLDDVLIAQVRRGQKQLEGLAKQRESLAARIKAANEFASSTTQSALQSFSLSSIFGEGSEGPVQLAKGLESAAAQVRKFTAQVNALAKRGLRKDLLSQVIGLGPEGGAALANSLSTASAAQIADLNEAQRQLDAASKRLGRDSADQLFDAGKNASKGFLAGLKSQQKDVENLMLTLARAMAKSIRRALGIKSPSRVFAAIGRQTMDGLSLGVDRQLSSVARSAVRAASALTEPFGPGVPAPSFAGAGAGGVGRFGGGFGGVDNSRSSSRTVNSPVTVNLNGTGYTDADAQRVVNRVVALASGL